MFEAGVLEMVLDQINVDADPYLANKALTLLNLLLINTSEEN